MVVPEAAGSNLSVGRASKEGSCTAGSLQRRNALITDTGNRVSFASLEHSLGSSVLKPLANVQIRRKSSHSKMSNNLKEIGIPS